MIRRPFTTSDVRQAITATGIRANVLATRTGHTHVLPTSNLKPWTPEEQETLEAAARSVGAEITYNLVKPNYTTNTVKAGFGFRCF